MDDQGESGGFLIFNRGQLTGVKLLEEEREGSLKRSLRSHRAPGKESISGAGQVNYRRLVCAEIAISAPDLIERLIEWCKFI